MDTFYQYKLINMMLATGYRQLAFIKEIAFQSQFSVCLALHSIIPINYNPLNSATNGSS